MQIINSLEHAPLGSIMLISLVRRKATRSQRRSGIRCTRAITTREACVSRQKFLPMRWHCDFRDISVIDHIANNTAPLLPAASDSRIAKIMLAARIANTVFVFYKKGRMFRAFLVFLVPRRNVQHVYDYRIQIDTFTIRSCVLACISHGLSVVSRQSRFMQRSWACRRHNKKTSA